MSPKPERALVRLLTGQDLSPSQASRIFRGIFTQRLPEEIAKAVLLLEARKGETAEELWGCVASLRQLDPPLRHQIPGLMDTCGTGGDRSQSINVSTLAALVIAGAGGKVAKHGNRALSSRCGSSDLMEAFGVRLEAPVTAMITSIKRYGIGYFHAPYYHPVFNRLQPLRRKLCQRTIFNFLGPLMNPLRLDYQFLGVAERDLMKHFCFVLRSLKRRRALLCSSEDGLDEISIAAPTRLLWIDAKGVRAFRIRPEDYGLSRTPLSRICGGTVRQNHHISLAVLHGERRGGYRDIVVLNAAAGLWVSGLAPNLQEGVKLAQAVLDDGRAYRALQGLIRMSRN